MPEQPALGQPVPPSGPLTQRIAEREAAETAASPTLLIPLTPDQADVLRRAAEFVWDMQPRSWRSDRLMTLYGAAGVVKKHLQGKA